MALRADGPVLLHWRGQPALISKIRRDRSPTVSGAVCGGQRPLCPPGVDVAAAPCGIAPSMGNRGRRLLRAVLRQVYRKEASVGSGGGGAATRRTGIAAEPAPVVRGVRDSRFR